jgi:pimeloyl-ACP methyl ester carboxylesterase
MTPMTRAQGPDGEIEYRVVGAPGAARAVLVLRTGALATTDPAPAITARWPVRLLLVDLDGNDLDDPPAYGGETPAGATATQVERILDRETPGAVVGLVAERAAVAFAVSLAAGLGDRVDRLALVSPPAPETPLARDVLEQRIGAVRARTVVFDGGPDDGAPGEGGPGDGDAPDGWGAWYAARFLDGRMQRRDARSSLGGALTLTAVWPDVLSHVASD